MIDGFKRPMVGMAVVSLLVGCSTPLEEMIPDRRPDYQKSKTSSELQLPPDLSSSTVNDQLQNQSLTTGLESPVFVPAGSSPSSPVVRETVLPAIAGMRVERDGQRRWLVIEGPPESVWSKAKAYWASNGFLLKSSDPKVGVMETEWSEHRADMASGKLQAVLQKYLGFLYSTPTKHKFRLRLERVGDHTELYLTPFGMEEVVERSGPGISRSTTTVWQPAPPDPGLQAEMLRRLMVFMGTPEAQAKTQVAGAVQVPGGPQMQLTTVEGQRALVIGADYARAWRLVGIALDRSDFSIDDQNRSQGRYVLEYAPEKEGDKSMFSALKFWDSDDLEKKRIYQVRLAGQGDRTVVVIQDKNDAPDRSKGAEQILDMLQKGISG